MICKFGCESGGYRGFSKAPPNNTAIGIISPVPASRLDLMPNVEIGHRVQFRAEAAGWHDDIHEVREVLFNGFRAMSAFVAGHYQVPCF